MKRELLLPLGALFGLAACSGGSSGSATPISGLSGPSQMSVVTADDEAGGGPPAGSGDGQGENAPGSGHFPPGSDYVTDDAELHIYDPSMESLGIINEILCMTSMTAYPRMVNDGPYTALVSEALCSTGQQEDDSQGQSSGGVDEPRSKEPKHRRQKPGAPSATPSPSPIAAPEATSTLDTV